ncbi:hypothetical protein DACRYDRAFT_65474 [Dacryopinax primogenitus]|uniref:RING-type domain-containing protein n=1 Tax=Dacryopinax primogenitus (strain DJM 731) TaxID=1858805 RepID=M5G3K8_DACPD|nr:uncharacterized protein DACRYDRAFT_65474 [Dacryopinax primogenitus]EJU03259.1 hypothetical protein DACRYDRAFT_65474 [Dacryopinax primogenitus]
MLSHLYSDNGTANDGSSRAMMISHGDCYVAVFLLTSNTPNSTKIWIAFDAQAGSLPDLTLYGLSIPLMLFPSDGEAIDYLWQLLRGMSTNDVSIRGHIFAPSGEETPLELDYPEFFQIEEPVEPEVPDPTTFRCGICMEDEQVTDRIRLNCAHEFCTSSLQGVVSSRVEEGLLPIPCPTCLAEDTDTSNYMTRDFCQRLDLPDRVADPWERLEVEEFGVMISCRRCGESGMIDREEFLAVDYVSCPFGGCIYRWCRHCDQPAGLFIRIKRADAADRYSRISQAMEEFGWEICPGGCGTRIEKTVGCYHMTCPAPGCHRHFCYRDGALIVRSEDRNAALEAVRAHYRNCQQFN